MKTISALAALLAFVFSFALGAYGEEREAARIENSVAVFKEVMDIPEKSIPPALLNEAHGVAIIPGVIKAGFIVGGRHGKGVVMVREGGAWSNPAFVSFTGGSIGWQIGAQSIDVILVFKSKRGVEDMIKGKFTLGADAAVAAGPVGRQAEAATDAQLKAEIYSYSRSRGLFAGVSLEGSVLSIDDDANAAYYGDAPAASILTPGAVSSPPAARKLREALASYTSR
ncbi:MAG: hypothetical protein Kow0025_00300 [Thermodesulfovibrionales bacterium]